MAPDFCGQVLGQARLMGAWDHFYPDSAFSPSVSTHYVNLPHWLPLSWADVALLKLPMGEQSTVPGNGCRWQMRPKTRSCMLMFGLMRLGYYADPALAQQQFGWQAHRSLAETCADAWRWQGQNPEGYE